VRGGWLLVVAGCGRVAFAPLAADDASDGGGTMNDATDGAAIDGGASLCSVSSPEIICDGFEDLTLASHWSKVENIGTVEIDTTRAYRGLQSLHARTNAATGSDMPVAELQSRRGLMMSYTGQVHARVWAYFASPVDPEFDQLIIFADQSGVGVAMGAARGNIIANDFTDLNLVESTTHTMPKDRWTCLQFDAPSGMTGTIHTFVDGVEVTDVRLTKSNAQPPFDNVYIGLDWPSNAAALPAADAWFDEMILDDAPISCAQ
jgi:hypothetical protein